MSSLVYQLLNKFKLFKKNTLKTLDNIQTVLDTNTNDISTLKTTVDTNMNDISTLKTNISSLKHYNNIITISAGDSFKLTNRDFNIDFTQANYNIKRLDSDNKVFINDVKIVLTIDKDGKNIIVYNNDTNDHDVLINIIKI